MEVIALKNEINFSYYLSHFFQSYLTSEKNFSSHTIASYAVTFKEFFEFCEKTKLIKIKKLKFENIGDEIIVDFLAWLEEAHGVTTTTRNQRLVAIHSFFRYVQRKSPAHMELCNEILNISYKKTQQTIVSYLTKDEMRVLLKQPLDKNRGEFRDKVLLSVLYDTGARVQELSDLRVKHVRLEKPAIITLHGKGNKTRQVPIMQSTVKLLKSYLQGHKVNSQMNNGDTPLFTNQRSEALSRWGVSYIIDKYVKRAKATEELKTTFPITPHIFRHSKAMHMLHSGVNLIYIRDFLGHVDVATTEIYARADTEMKRKAIEASCEDIIPSENIKDWNENGDIMNFLKSLY